MARLLSQTLLLRHATATSTTTTTTTTTTKTPQSVTSLLQRRHRSSQSSKAQLIEIDLDSSEGDVEALGGGIRKLEDLIQRFIVQRSAPAWLPFIPGSSYWVPPSKSPCNLGELIGKLANPLSEEESLSLTTVRGWPCSSFLIGDGASEPPAEVKVEHTSIDGVEVVEVEVEAKVQTSSGNTSRSEDEEG